MGHGRAGLRGLWPLSLSRGKWPHDDGWMGHRAVTSADEAPNGPWRQDGEAVGAEALSGEKSRVFGIRFGPPRMEPALGTPKMPQPARAGPSAQGSVDDRRTLRWGDYAGSWGGLQIKGLRSGFEAGGLAVVRRSSRSGQDCDLGASTRQPRGLALSSVQEPREVSLTGAPGAGSRVSPSPCDGEGGISLIHCGVASSPWALHLCPGLVKPRAGPRGAQRVGLAGGPCCPWVESGASWL